MVNTYLVIENWERLKNNALIPICQPNDYNLEHLDCRDELDRQYANISLPKNIVVDSERVKKFWKLLKKGYKCAAINKSLNNLKVEDELIQYLYYRVRFPACKQDHKKKKQSCRQEKCTSEDFLFKKFHSINVFKEEFLYVSDPHGIAILHADRMKLRCYYYHFQTDRISFAKINMHLKHYENCCVKLCKGSLWLIKYSGAYPTVVHLIYFKSGTSDVWYHLVSMSLVVNAVVDDIYVSRCVCAISKKCVLFVDKSKLRTDVLNHQNFVSLTYSSGQPRCASIPLNQLQLVGVVDTNLVMVGSRSDNKPNLPIVYIMCVESTSLLKLVKVIDIVNAFENYQNIIPYGFELAVYPYAKKALIKSGAGYYIVIDLIQYRICQILSYIDCFWSCQVSIKFSTFNNEIRLIGRNYHNFRSTDNYLCIKFNLHNGFTLTDLALQCVAQHFNMNTIQLCNLPKHLFDRLKLLLS